MLTWWLDTDAPYSADEMFVMFRKMTVDGATSFYGGSPSDPIEPASS